MGLKQRQFVQDRRSEFGFFCLSALLKASLALEYLKLGVGRDQAGNALYQDESFQRNET